MRSIGTMIIDVAEGARGRYVRATWMSGVLPMHADITSPTAEGALNRLATEIGASIHVTDAARAVMKGRGWQR